MIHDYAGIEKHAVNMRKLILDMGKHAGAHAAHIGGALSITDVLAALYFGVMNICDVGCEDPKRDRCILSKGHASLALYAALIEAGFIPEDMKNTFEDDYSYLLGHPVKNRSLGIEFTTGSLGMGFSEGVGVAIACKMRHISNRVFVILGDGECNEGAVWEAFMSASHFSLDNLVAIIDRNNFQLSGKTDEVMKLGDLVAKLEAFGWETYEVDGHDIRDLCNVLDPISNNCKPRAIIMNTIKGKGLSFAENDNNWHHTVVTQKAYEQGLIELGYGGI